MTLIMQLCKILLQKKNVRYYCKIINIYLKKWRTNVIILKHKIEYYYYPISIIKKKKKKRKKERKKEEVVIISSTVQWMIALFQCCLII